MIIGVPKESRPGEKRVSLTPEAVKKLIKKGFQVKFEADCGELAGFPDDIFVKEGATLAPANEVWGSQIVLKIQRPTQEEVSRLQKNALLISFAEPYHLDGTFEKLAGVDVTFLGMELIPRTSRAQSMDALSSQANIAGYRAVLEAATNYKRYFPLMMTSAGSAKPVKVMVLGAGVAGLQAIATAKRLGATIEAYDVRNEVKEQIQSLGAKFVELDVGEEGSGQGGYAKELSESAKAKQQQLLTDRLKKCDVIISTANIPGRKAPVLITEEAVKGMRAGSVIVDMAAGNGGNCPLSEADRIVVKHGVTLVGYTQYPSMVASDSSNFFANNLIALLGILVETKEGKLSLNVNLQDDIVAASLVTHQGKLMLKKA